MCRSVAPGPGADIPSDNCSKDRREEERTREQAGLEHKRKKHHLGFGLSLESGAPLGTTGFYPPLGRQEQHKNRRVLHNCLCLLSSVTRLIFTKVILKYPIKTQKYIGVNKPSKKGSL